MPEVTHRTAVRLPREKIWGFIQDMNNWAPMLTGYREHEVKSETESVWTLQGEVGMLSRRVNLEVHITEWTEPSRVSFTLKGLNEAVDGDGTFEMTPQDETQKEAQENAPASEKADTNAAPTRTSLWSRFIAWLFRRVMGASRTHHAPPSLPVSPGPSNTLLSFRLRMDAGGPTAPMVNAVLGPALLPATEDLAEGIAAHLHQAHGLAEEESNAEETTQKEDSDKKDDKGNHAAA